MRFLMPSRNIIVLPALALIVFWANAVVAQTRWTKYEGNPVVEGTSGTWDANWVSQPSVLYVDDEYKMWYAASDASPADPYRIGYATSPDGINWTKYDDPNTPDPPFDKSGPVLEGDSGAWDWRGVFGANVVLDGNVYKMWYQGSNSLYNRIGYATSPDGVSWTKYDDPSTPDPPFDKSDPVLDRADGEWEHYQVTQPTVLFDGTEYKMWYMGVGYEWIHRIGYATSPDGINWTKYDDPSTPDPPFAESDPVLWEGEDGEWDDMSVLVPSVLFDGTMYRMWYAGSGGSRHRIGCATAPLDKIAVEIDIKPGSYPNSINIGSQGVIPVAVLSSENFNAAQVDPMSVALAGAGVAIRGKGKALAHEEDANGDGLTDLVIQVETENLDPGQFQDGYAVLTGQTYDGDPIEGSDEITIVPSEAAPAEPFEFEAPEPYPKPANPETWIPYKLLKDVEISINIYNANGQLIRFLDLGRKPAGFYTTKEKAAFWDGKNETGEQVASGIYFYTIQAGDDFIATKKMVIAK